MLYYAIIFCSQCLHYDGKIVQTCCCCTNILIAELRRPSQLVGIEVVTVRSFE